jgi:hypothetical protein
MSAVLGCPSRMRICLITIAQIAKPRSPYSYRRVVPLTEEAPMISIPKVVGVMSCGFLLCLGLSTAAQADNAASEVDSKLKAEQTDRRQGGQDAGEKQVSEEMKGGDSTGGKTIKGEVLRVEGNDCFIKGQDGKEVRLHIDAITLKARNIEPGERIEAKVNDQNHVLSILSGPAVTDRRNDKE